MNAEHIQAKTALIFSSIIDETITGHLPKQPGKNAEAKDLQEYNKRLEKATRDKFVLESVGHLVAQLLIDIHRVADAAEHERLRTSP